jgi:hypothetical protein
MLFYSHSVLQLLSSIKTCGNFAVLLNDPYIGCWCSGGSPACNAYGARPQHFV